MKIRLMFAWYDLWVGVFVDRSNRRLYIFPLPTLGIKISLPKRVACARCDSRGYLIIPVDLRYMSDELPACDRCAGRGYITVAN